MLARYGDQLPGKVVVDITNPIDLEAVDVVPLIMGTVGLGDLASVLDRPGIGETTHAKVLVDPER